MTISRLQAHQYVEQAKLIHTSLDVWYRTHLNMNRFGSDWRPFLLMSDVYEALDPGCGLVVSDEAGVMLGTAFYHPRETHVGVGVVSVHPDAFGRGVAKALMQEILSVADGRPLRLVSSAMNIDSFSLYTRMGFVPQVTLQSLTLKVPAEGLQGGCSGVRAATMADVEAMGELEFRLNGVRKDKDYRFFVENAWGHWRLLVMEKADGSLAGFLGANAHPADRILGPGVAEDEAAMQGLVQAMLDRHFRGTDIVWMVPVRCTGLVRQGYGWGARNRETHLLSVLGNAPPMHGVVIPTFMPESG
ncbi:MAG: Acetyltransferase [Verrucomicrobiaceae bacterium]|nr:Acetyltransferase [Verrucomicrobiaceae bacterium]